MAASQRYRGGAAVVANNGRGVIGRTRLLPNPTAEPLAATLVRWRGMYDTDLLTALPKRRNSSAGKLGLV